VKPIALAATRNKKKEGTVPPDAIPFIPVRAALYTGAELLGGFRTESPESFTQTADFRIYRYFRMHGGRFPEDPYISMMQALHDNSINQAVDSLRKGRRIAGIMGGHTLKRGDARYADVVRLARRLTQSKILMCSGGAVGAMEACHLGALLANSHENIVTSALQTLCTQCPDWPSEFDSKLVDEGGIVNTQAVRAIHTWLSPAFTVLDMITNPGESLAIPTWHYGFEPPTPFASHIAKYFQNSIREDGLVTYARQGVIFAEGRAGTLQEIFQDAAQNAYLSCDYFSPMVFLGTEYWTRTVPVRALLSTLFRADDFAKHTLFTDSIDAAADFIEQFPA
jgi:predicted Rossmann-fold nucleotide-binding protein